MLYVPAGWVVAEVSINNEVNRGMRFTNLTTQEFDAFESFKWISNLKFGHFGDPDTMRIL